MKTLIKLDFNNDTGNVILTNSSGDTYSSKNEELIDFLCGCAPEISLEKEEKPTHILSYKIDWKDKTVSVPQVILNNDVYKAIEDTAKILGLKIQLSI